MLQAIKTMIAFDDYLLEGGLSKALREEDDDVDKEAPPLSKSKSEVNPACMAAVGAVTWRHH